MAKHSPVERMRSLHEQIAYHGHKYFVEDDPQITDPEYDKLYREFSELCDKHPELATEFEFANKPVPIAEPTGEMLKTASFSVPMLGSKKANSVEEIESFQKTFNPGTTFVYEQKVDGLALEVRYVHSAANLLVLDRIATRGAGMVGEDVTHSLRLFSQTSGIPGQILWSPEYGPQPEEFLVRGEGYVTHAIFDLLNEGYEKKKATPRNAVAGWIRALPENQDESVVGQLQFAAYWTSHRLDKNSYHGQRNKLIAMRLLPAEVVKFNDIQQNKRGTEIPVDGIMVKADQFSEWDRVGSSAKFPNYMIAYKYPNEEVHSPMETVEWNTSRFGRVVPTGKYRPVKIGGVMCRSASLDNYGSFMDLGLSVGDVVSVTRNNDVVPRINSIVEHADGPLLEAPTECPSCSYLLEVQVGKTSSDLVCNNVSACPAQLVRRCMNLVDKFGLDIDGLGPTLISVLVSAGWVKKPADLLTLPVSSRILIRKRVQENIEDARFQPVYRFIKALGLPGVGIVLAKRIANKISAIAEKADNVEGVIEDALTDVNLLLSVKGISTGGALAITNAFNDATFEENFGDLYDVMELDYTAVPENDLRVAVTGTLEGSREELVEYFANASIELTDKLTKDCSYLIVGERPGKAKLLKATELSIPTLVVSEFSSVDAVIQAIKGAVQ